jgi:hypothetical protein
MVTEDDVIRAIDKPRQLFSVQMVVNPGSKGTDELHALLLRMRDAGKVKFDIKTGRWAKSR